MRVRATAVVAAALAVSLSLAGAAAATSASDRTADLPTESGSGIPTTTVGTESPNEDEQPDESGPPDIDAYMAQFATEHGVPLETAYRLAEVNDALIDFSTSRGDDPAFGAAWSSLDGARVVAHVRLVGHAPDAYVAELERQIGDAVTLHFGGASARAVEELVELKFSSEDLRLNWVFDHSTGVADVAHGLDVARSVLGHDNARHTESFDLGADLNRSGADIWYNQPGQPAYNNGICTVGAVWRRSNPTPRRGYITAGHCPQWNAAIRATGSTYYYSGSPSRITFNCGTNGDAATYSFQGEPSLGTNFVNKSSVPYGTTTWQLAGGFNVNQQAFKIGHTDNGASYRATTGVVDGYRTSSGSCGPYTAVGVTADAKGGDSGGPTFVLYNGTWHLLGWNSTGYGLKSGTTNEYRNVNVMMHGWTNLPAGATICRPGSC